MVGELNRNVEDINQLTMETADIAHHLTESSRNLQHLRRGSTGWSATSASGVQRILS